MQMPPIDVRTLAQSGAQALRRGDPRTARESFERIVAAGQADASTCLALAHACRALDEHAAAHAAVDKALALEPRNLRALILKADHLAAEGDKRTASSFYQAAVRIAPPAHELPAELRGELGRAQSMCTRYAAEYEAFLRNRVGRGLEERASTKRFRHSLDILFGKRQIYFQQPQYFFFPGLPQIQFYDRNDFPWLDRVEAATADIRAELIEVMKDQSVFKPYVQGDPGRRPQGGDRGMLNNPDWSAFYLWKDGEIVPENAARCPRTLDALADVPAPRVRNRSPSVLFSLLRPGAHIPPHNGLVNTRLICHLPLVVPPKCAFRVGNDTFAPVEGKAWVFDDTMEHEAWNGSDRARVILLFETWRPELTDEERGLVTAMFDAIDAYSGDKPAWEI